MSSRKRWMIGGAAVLAAVLVGAGVWAVGRDGPATAAPPPAAPAAPAAVESGCGLPGSPDVDGAKAASWVDMGGGWMLPVSSTDGPGVRDPHGPWSCFAHTESGAVLAGYVITLRVDLADDRRAVITTQTRPERLQQAALSTPPAAAPARPTVKGFNVVGYEQDRATIGYYLHTPQLEAQCTVNVVWSGGDWRVELQDDGQTSSGCQPGVPDRFTPWGPPA